MSPPLVSGLVNRKRISVTRSFTISTPSRPKRTLGVITGVTVRRDVPRDRHSTGPETVVARQTQGYRDTGWTSYTVRRETRDPTLALGERLRSVLITSPDGREVITPRRACLTVGTGPVVVPATLAPSVTVDVEPLRVVPLNTTLRPVERDPARPDPLGEVK